MTNDYITLHYPLPGSDSVDTGRIIIYDQQHATTTATTNHPANDITSNRIDTLYVLFFCGGYPDNCTIFQPMAQHFTSTTTNMNHNNYDTSSLSSCSSVICGITCLPGYDIIHQNYKMGYTFDEMVITLQEALKVFMIHVTTQVIPSLEQQPSNNNNKSSNINIQLIGIFHDWGCYVGTMLMNRLHMMNRSSSNPNSTMISSSSSLQYYFHKVVYLDVLPPIHRNNYKSVVRTKTMGIKKAIIVTLYTLLFALCHGIQRYISFYIAAPINIIGYGIIKLLQLSPVRSIDSQYFYLHRPKEYTLYKLIQMQYPYYELWSGMLWKGPKMFLKTTFSDATLPEYIQQSDKNDKNNIGTPILYMYGMNKNTMFHDENVIDWINKQQQQQDGIDASLLKSVIAVPNAGHWLHWQQPNICYEAISKFIFG